jgi:hypothetical protein
MSTIDTMTPLVSAPWLDACGNPLPVRTFPGLRPEVIQGLECSYPGILSPPLRALLGICCGLAGTELGSIDFTGCWFPEEPCPVFRPCLTLAIDDAGRRWIAETGDNNLPGPIWCVFPNPKVAVYVSDNLAGFIAALRDYTCRGATHANDSARLAVWTRGGLRSPVSLWTSAGICGRRGAVRRVAPNVHCDDSSDSPGSESARGSG